MLKPTITVLILAAGSSSRFGSPKQLLKWKNSNLLQHTIQTAKKSIAQHVVVVLGANYDIILKNINTDSTEIIRNESWEKGLGNSIAFGINSIIKNNPESDGVLIMLADQPLIETSHLNKLIEQFRYDKKQIIASTYSNKKFGVPVVFDACYFSDLNKLNSDEGAKAIIEKNRSNVIEINQDCSFEDIDTIKDFWAVSFLRFGFDLM